MSSIIPMIKCKDMKESISLYVDILDFCLIGTWQEAGSPSFSVLRRGGDEIHLSTHSGDGVFGTVFSVVVDDLQSLYKMYIKRGMDTSNKKESPVHQTPIDQSWGNKEFYVNDPNGNTIRFIERPDSAT